MSYSKAAAAIAAADTVTVTTHINPDGDGIGAALALLEALEGMGKRVRFCCPSPVARRYAFLPGFDRIEVVDDEARARRLKPCDVLVSCDCGDLARLCACAALRCQALVNLDHHASNDKFGSVNVVDLKAASTGVVVAGVLKRLGVDLSTDMATNLYTTIVFDTGRFMHSNTTAAVFRFAARLLDTGIDAAAINRALTYTRTEIDLRIDALGIARLSREGALAGIALSAKDIASLGDEVEDWGDLVDVPRSLQGVEVAYLMREAPDRKTVRCSLRSNPPYAVGPVAQEFGGGGHLQAAGCTFEGNLKQAKVALLPRLAAVAAEA
jgi:phosphoesterase RecJ-like protein